MDISIIILNYKQKDLVEQCIKKILVLDLRLNYEIIVVDNASGDGCIEMVKEKFLTTPLNNRFANLTGQIKTIETKNNKGYAAGNNLGIKAASGKYILILNPDIIVLDKAIEKMYQFMKSHRECGLCGPKLINPDGSVQLSCRKFPNWKIPIYRRTILGRFNFAKKSLKKFLMEDWDHKEIRTVDWILGAAIMTRKSAIDKIGLLDERFFLYFEDVDWCRRFWKAGYKVFYIANAEMVHRHQRISAKESGLKSLLSRATRIHLVSGIKYFLKYKFKTKPNLTC